MFSWEQPSGDPPVPTSQSSDESLVVEGRHPSRVSPSILLPEDEETSLSFLGGVMTPSNNDSVRGENSTLDSPEEIASNRRNMLLVTPMHRSSLIFPAFSCHPIRKSKSQPCLRGASSSSPRDKATKQALLNSEHNPHVGYFLLRKRLLHYSSSPGLLSYKSRKLNPKPILKKQTSTLKDKNISFSDVVTVTTPVGSSWGQEKWQPPSLPFQFY